MSVTVILTIYNGSSFLGECLSRLHKWTDDEIEIVVVDDGSSDHRIPKLLSSFANARKNVSVIRNSNRLGYLKTVNSALLQVRNDVVLLNSDVFVTRHWLEKLLEVPRRFPRTKIVSPLSNCAGLLSLPSRNQSNTLRFGVTVDSISDIVGNCSAEYPEVPHVAGMCTWFSRDVFESVGMFDPVFGEGYCEETDLCLRALEFGFEIRCCDSLYVHHLGGRSFSEIGCYDARKTRNINLLYALWPNLSKLESRFLQLDPLQSLRRQVENFFNKSHPAYHGALLTEPSSNRNMHHTQTT